MSIKQGQIHGIWLPKHLRGHMDMVLRTDASTDGWTNGPTERRADHRMDGSSYRSALISLGSVALLTSGVSNKDLHHRVPLPAVCCLHNKMENSYRIILKSAAFRKSAQFLFSSYPSIVILNLCLKMSEIVIILAFLSDALIF